MHISSSAISQKRTRNTVFGRNYKTSSEIDTRQIGINHSLYYKRGLISEKTLVKKLAWDLSKCENIGGLSYTITSLWYGEYSIETKLTRSFDRNTVSIIYVN